MSTLMAILDQDKLNIDSELDLFNALLRFANERSVCSSEATIQNPLTHNEQNVSVAAGPVAVNAVNAEGLLSVEEIKMEPDVNAMMQGHDEHFMNDNDDNMVYHHPASSPDVVVVDSDASVADGGENEESSGVNNGLPVAPTSPTVSYEQPTTSSAAAAAAAGAVNLNYLMETPRSRVDEETLKKAVKKIRFLTMTPQQFAEGPARSKLLQQHEALAILIKISSPSINDCPMPEGFCSSRCSRNYYEQRNNPRDLSTFLHAHPSNNFFNSSGVGGSGNGGNCGTLNANNFASLEAPLMHVQAPQILSSNRNSLVGSNQRNRDNAAVSLVTNAGDPGDGATHDTRRSYCVRTVNPQFDYRNTSVTDCGLTFQVDTNIWITGKF